MTNTLVVCSGYLGDHMFTSEIARKLIEEKLSDTVDVLIGFPQVKPFFERNPYIRNVLFDGVTPAPRYTGTQYDKVIHLPHISKTVPPAEELQRHCGIKNASSKFVVRTDPTLDAYVRESYGPKERPVLSIMNGWGPKTFRFTREQYDAGIDVPNLGYGGSHRDTDYIVSQLEQRFDIIVVGMPFGHSQLNVDDADVSLDLTASIIKYCDYFIGAEGGLANLAYAVGTKTILTSDFIHQLYGPNGVLAKIQEPKLGPVYYESDVPHYNLDPYLTDDEVVQQITEIVNMKRLVRFGVAGRDFSSANDARGETYTRSDGTFPPTNLACKENVFADRLKTAKTILDFGCGVGRNLSWIMENTTANYIGLDPNHSMLSYFWEVQEKEYGDVSGWRDRVTLYKDFSDIPHDVRFDYVVSTFVLQHLGYRYQNPEMLNLTDITKQILERMNSGAVFFAIEHDSEENWLPRWFSECDIQPNVYIRSYKGLPELTDRDHTAPNGGNHLIIFERV